MPVTKKPLKRSVFIGCCIFVLSLSIVLSILAYRTYTESLYKSYQLRMADIIVYVKNHIDMEDLYNCTKTNVESEKYKELMGFMDNICDNFAIHYLYICMPVKWRDEYGMRVVLSADTTYNRQHNPDGLDLGYVSYDGYSAEEVQRFFDRMDNEGITYFKNYSDWGYDYTAMETLQNEAGEVFGFLCVDIEVDELERRINTYLLINVLIIISLGILFTAIFLKWLNMNVTDPISRLEKSVVAFAAKSHKNRELSQLNYVDPGVSTGNEVELLAGAVSRMTEDIREYVQNILEAEDEVETMKNQVSHMGTVAYQDSLTMVKNKAWYDKTKEELDKEIKENRPSFAIVMIDLNQLKLINDTYGHEHGDEYIMGSCHQICNVFVHSSVFRVGGDEFVVLLKNMDYNNRSYLMEKLRSSFEKSFNDESRKPWDRYSAASGMAIFDSRTDKCMDDVFRRADALMYEDKQKFKYKNRKKIQKEMG